jgi:hypothetical protein
VKNEPPPSRRLGRSARRRRDDVPAEREESARRRAVGHARSTSTASIKSTAIKLPLNQKDFRQNIAAIVKTANDRALRSDSCTSQSEQPDWPHVTKDEIKQRSTVPQG